MGGSANMGKFMRSPILLKKLPLEYVSPSQISTLETCFLQTAFGTAPWYRSHTFVGPKARLGRVCHTLLEKVLKGELDHTDRVEWRTELVKSWDSLVKQEEKAVQSSQLEGHLGPAQRWPGYSMLRARILAIGHELLGHRQSGSVGGGTFRSEVWFSAYGGKLHGRADVVRISPSGVELEDYKTGEVYEQADNLSQIVKPQYLRQLLLYAAMYHDTAGEWPVRAYLVPLTGGKISITIDPAEAEGEAQKALISLSAYNKSIAAAPAMELLASPSAASCRFCAYKAFCEPFWSDASASWEWQSSIALEGVVLSSRLSQIGEFLLEVQAHRGSVVNGVYKISGIRTLNLEVGEYVRLLNLYPNQSGGERELRITDYTEIWRQSAYPQSAEDTLR
ncbi:MAG: hypothetical protein EXR62_05350 [Chloroflexi bacterium]|nr:hypothetical protein [Chloroflexota bacterium]